MGQQSDTKKSQLVTEICSLSTRSIACPHRHPCSPVETHFIDWYCILGVEENAETEAIRKQYHKLALQLHPDKNQHPKAEIAFKLVLEAYSCLSDNSKRRAFDSKRRKNICVKCNRIPSVSCKFSNNLCASKLKEWNPAHRSRSYGISQSLKDIRDRFKEEAKVMESCLRANSTSRKEYPLFNPSSNLFQSNSHCAPRRESAIFDPSNHLFEGYPHIRNRIYEKSDSFRYLQRKNRWNYGIGTGRYNSQISENRSGREAFNSKSASVHS